MAVAHRRRPLLTMIWIVLNLFILVGCFTVLYRTRSRWSFLPRRREPGTPVKTQSMLVICVFVAAALLISGAIQSALGGAAGIISLVAIAIGGRLLLLSAPWR
jgi:Na+/H+ antiporter NhaD/arsenite permease-like protein